MNKSEFIAAIAEKTGMTKVDSQKAVNAFQDVVIEALKEGDKVALLGFGTFSVVQKAERMGINPSSKEPIKIPAKKVAKFKPGAGFDNL